LAAKLLIFAEMTKRMQEKVRTASDYEPFTLWEKAVLSGRKSRSFW
jgi:hypothetical protein